MTAFSRHQLRRFSAFAAALSVSLFLLAFCSELGSQRLHRTSAASDGFQSGGISTRKLLAQDETGGASTDRIGEGCSKDDITVHQAATPPMPNGIPTYTVEVLNMCSSGCAMAEIHFACGWFSSARQVNPRVFRRLRYNDCLVNDGRPLPPGASVSFQYANSFSYPMSVSSASCS